MHFAFFFASFSLSIIILRKPSMFCVLVVDSFLLLNSKYPVMWINCSCFIYSGVGCPHRTSLVAQMVKCQSTMRETRVQSLGWEDPLEKEMAIHSSTIAWKIPWTEEPGRLESMGSQRVGHD